jgi:predicted O-methyltransferase YrrM
MKKENIINHELFIPSIQKINELNKSIEDIGGSVPHNHHHILFIIKELLGDKCKNYLEIGVASGGSMLSVMQSKYKTKYWGIDLFNHKYLTSLHKDETVLEKVTKIIDTLNSNAHEYSLIEGDSADETTVNYVKDIKEGIDLFFIDGNHSQTYVNSDFSLYEKYINKGGVVVFDDNIIPHPNLIPSNYTHLGTIPREAYTLHYDQLQQTNISSGKIIYNYKGAGDDVRNRDNWQHIFVKN